MSLDQFMERCERLAALQPSDLAGAFGDVEQIVRMGIEDNFNTASTTADSPWPPRKVLGDGHPLLEEISGPGAGSLKRAATQIGATGSVSRVVDGCELHIGVSAEPGLPGGLPGARVHQYGYPEKNIPSREYIGVSNDTLDFVCERVADELLAQIF